MKQFFKKILGKLGIISLIAFLGAIGGSANASKGIRRFGISGTTMVLAFLRYFTLFPKNLFFISIMFGSFILSLGYGIPSANDKGSDIGRFWYKIFKENKTLTNIFTRGTIGFLYCLTLLSIPIIIGNWWIYFGGMITVICAYSFISWKNLGSVQMGKYTVCYSDVILYGIIGINIVFLLK